MQWGKKKKILQVVMGNFLKNNDLKMKNFVNIFDLSLLDFGHWEKRLANMVSEQSKLLLIVYAHAKMTILNVFDKHTSLTRYYPVYIRLLIACTML